MGCPSTTVNEGRTGMATEYSTEDGKHHRLAMAIYWRALAS
jgi:hypothetical protein